MVDAIRQKSRGTPKATRSLPRNAGAEARKEYEGALKKWEI